MAEPTAEFWSRERFILAGAEPLVPPTCGSDFDNEELADCPQRLKEKDIFFGRPVLMKQNNQLLRARVIDIEICLESKQKYYLTRFDDGAFIHLDEDQVRKFSFPED